MTRTLLLCAVIAGCAGNGTTPGTPMVDASGSPDSGPLMFTPDATSDAAPAPPSNDVLVYAHSDTTLFSLDPTTLSVARIGAFATPGGGTDSITDIAITKTGEIYGCSYDVLYRVDARTAALTPIGDLRAAGFLGFNGFNALSFVPDDSGNETLIGAANDGTYYRVDEATAAVTRLGEYSGRLRSSGDIVGVARGGTFATVLGPTSDALVRIDAASGTATPIGTGTGFSDIWGLGYFRQKLYGFTASGQIVVIDVNTGVGQLANTTAGTDTFWGAGVTTIAPVDLI